MANNNNSHKSPKRGSNILCRVSNPTPEMVVRYVKRLPKNQMPESQFRKIMGDTWFNNEHQAPEQWGLYYIDGTTYYPRFSRNISLAEAKRYLNGWLKRLIVINPYTKFRVSNDSGLVLSIVKHLEEHPDVHDLKTIIRDIIDSDEPFIVNDILANTLNMYSEVLKVDVVDKDRELFNVQLLSDYQEVIKNKYMNKKEYFHLFDGIVRIQNPDTTAQMIYYGCPGTGKSFEVKKIAEGESGQKLIWYEPATASDKTCKKVDYVPNEEQKKKLTNNVFRTTFHPDYDYATFVGCYKPGKNDDNELDYRFVPQVFTKAYVAALRHPKDPIYLIIEEINRGNCAQIFGDLFQLLDRTNGESDYEIKPDTELAKYLESEGVPHESLKLPANLHIYATMNTSDQSLFPMDSAFKRRWSMEYLPIDYEQEDAKEFTITIGKKVYQWIEFLQMVNEMIVNATTSEDKQMGEFFIKGDITEREFVNKVMFYLWNDVCKDLYNPHRVMATYFLRVKNRLDGEKNDFFTFAELFSERNKDFRLIHEFMLYLESKYKEEHQEFKLTVSDVESE